MNTRCYLLFLSFVLITASAQAQSPPDWQLSIEQAYEAAKENKQIEAFHSLHKALAQSSIENVRTVLKETVNIYRKLGELEKAETITKLILTPPANVHQDAFVRAMRIKERKREVLKAADNATRCNDYLLADILYSSLIPQENIYQKIKGHSLENAHYETGIVDRLVRLYLKHKDVKRAESLVLNCLKFETYVLTGEGKRLKGNTRMALLNVDLALVKMAKGKYSEAIKLFQKAVITLERSRRINKDQIATIYSDFALTLDRAGKKCEAKRNYQKALAIARQSNTIEKTTRDVIEKNYARFLERQK